MKQWASKYDLSDRVALKVESEQIDDFDYGIITAVVFEGGVSKYRVNWPNAAHSYHYEYELKEIKNERERV